MKSLCKMCDDVVLQIQGSDLFIEPYKIDSAHGARLIEGDVIGPIHSVCLRNSGYAHFYAPAMRAFYEHVLQLNHIIDFDGGFVTRHDNTGDIDAVYCNTYSISIPSHQVSHLKTGDSDTWVFKKVEMEAEVTLDDAGKNELKSQLLKEGINLLYLLKTAGINHCLYDRIGLDTAIIRPYRDDPDLSFFELQRNRIAGELSYKVRLPSEVIRAMREI